MSVKLGRAGRTVRRTPFVKVPEASDGKFTAYRFTDPYYVMGGTFSSVQVVNGKVIFSSDFAGGMKASIRRQGRSRKEPSLIRIPVGAPVAEELIAPASR